MCGGFLSGVSLLPGREGGCSLEGIGNGNRVSMSLIVVSATDVFLRGKHTSVVDKVVARMLLRGRVQIVEEGRSVRRLLVACRTRCGSSAASSDSAGEARKTVEVSRAAHSFRITRHGNWKLHCRLTTTICTGSLSCCLNTSIR